jgi:hypothetical protein
MRVFKESDEHVRLVYTLINSIEKMEESRKGKERLGKD